MDVLILLISFFLLLFIGDMLSPPMNLRAQTKERASSAQSEPHTTSTILPTDQYLDRDRQILAVRLIRICQ